MADVSVTYYTGDWSDRDRDVVKHALNEEGLRVVIEGRGVVKGLGDYPLQLLIDVSKTSVIAAQERDMDELIRSVVRALHRLFDEFRDRKPIVIVTIDVVRYIVSDEQSIDDIPIEYRTGLSGRRGERWWRDGRWQTFDEVYGRK